VYQGVDDGRARHCLALLQDGGHSFDRIVDLLLGDLRVTYVRHNARVSLGAAGREQGE
jgi:hypothetical protein